MNILGLSGGFHDAAATVIDRSGRILFAAHSERYSKKKNDANLDCGMLEQCVGYGIDHIVWYERPWLHNVQQLISGQKLYGAWTAKSVVKSHMNQHWPGDHVKISSVSHHLSHAAAGFQTSGFDRAAVVVCDAIGELDTVSIYLASYSAQGRAQYQRLWRQSYPHSIGLFYSAVTESVGLRPMEEEYITMGMAAYGSAQGADRLRRQLIADISTARFKTNLHVGLPTEDRQWISHEDLAASAQCLTEQLIHSIMHRAQDLTGCRDLVYMGGVALNCVANARVLGDFFDRVWIMPNPGDAGSSLGAAALVHGQRLQWQNAFLGHEITGPYPVQDILHELLNTQIVGVASGRAEFGPRALGNRSLLADPRGPDIKDRVNLIKRRQKFRPFAPVILEEHVHEYFRMPSPWKESRYMQTVAQVYRPDLYPAISHVDGSARVQTVPADGSGIRQLLETWYAQTGCPMLLNTSLNIRGEPMVNDRADADRFERLYGVRVCS